MINRIRHAAHLVQAALHEAKKKVARSPHWAKVEHEHLAKNPQCLACGGVERLQVHHIQPFHLHPELELEPSNLVTLCMGEHECHLEIGHGGDFKKYNPIVVACAMSARKDPQLFDKIVEQSHQVARR